jgi:hypothetical protein
LQPNALMEHKLPFLAKVVITFMIVAIIVLLLFFRCCIN